MVPEWVIRARLPCVAIPAALSPALITPLLVISASSPNTLIAAPKAPTLIAPALLTMARLPCARMPVALAPAVIVAPARLLTVLSSLIAKMAASGTVVLPIVIWPAFVMVLLPATKIATLSSPRAMTPEAALTIVLFTPAKMPALFGPAESVPLLVTELKSLTPIHAAAAVADGRAGQHVDGEIVDAAAGLKAGRRVAAAGDGLAARRRIGRAGRVRGRGRQAHAC